MNWYECGIIAVPIACIGGAALAADERAGDIKPLGSVKFAPDPDVKCLLSAVETGDLRMAVRP